MTFTSTTLTAAILVALTDTGQHGAPRNPRRIARDHGDPRKFVSFWNECRNWASASTT
jgi:hypothetical protein